jgi:hypothetical protein
MYNGIGTLKLTVDTNGDIGFELSILKVIDPEGVPVRETSGPRRIPTTVPRWARTSNSAAEKGNPIPRRTTSPVEVRAPAGSIITDPPEAPR